MGGINVFYFVFTTPNNRLYFHGRGEHPGVLFSGDYAPPSIGLVPFANHCFLLVLSTSRICLAVQPSFLFTQYLARPSMHSPSYTPMHVNIRRGFM